MIKRNTKTNIKSNYQLTKNNSSLQQIPDILLANISGGGNRIELESSFSLTDNLQEGNFQKKHLSTKTLSVESPRLLSGG